MFDELFAHRGLSFDRLKVLLEIHAAGSIARAAPDDPVRQSQYSRQLRELAEFFGTALTRRHGKQLRLSAAGERLAEIARQHFRALQDLRAECRTESLDYSIAAGDSLLQWLIIPRLHGAKIAKLAVRFATFNLRTNEIVAQLADGRLDFGLVRRDAVSDDLAFAALGTLTYRMIVPHALRPKQERITLRDVFASLPLAAQTTDGQFSRRLHEIAAEADVELRPFLSCQSFPQTFAAVRSGGYAAVLPSLALGDVPKNEFQIIDGVALRRLDREMALAWNPRLLRIRPSAPAVRETLAARLDF